jgi:carboxypeptidase family protein
MPRNSSCAWRSGVVLFILAGLLLACNPSLLAQTAGTGALTGTVTDSSGAVVPNAIVTATSLDTGQARMATTGSDGTYSIGLLTPGKYRVKFEAAGFKAVEIPSATVTVTETAVLDRALEVGAQEQTITVASEVETIQAASSALGTVATARTVSELPLSTRNYTNLLAMSSGANASVQDASLLGKGTTLIAVNGAGTAQNTFLQDGVVINNWFSFNTGVEGVSVGGFAIPNPDAISEFKIQTSTYDAGYGRNPGANVNVVTKSGSNDFHGNAFEFFRNTALNANTWFRDYNGLPKPVLNSNQYGGVFGGPIKKNKLFFFVSYQETGQKNGLTGYGAATATAPPIPGNRGNCPTPNAANTATSATYFNSCDGTAQAFIQSLATNISPLAPCNPGGVSAPRNQNDVASTAGSIQIQCPAGGTTDALFNINPVAIKMLQLQNADGTYLVPGSGLAGSAVNGGYALQTYSIPAIFKDHNGMGNFDYVINGKNTLSGRYQYERDPLEAPFPVQNALQQGNFTPGNPIETIKWNHSAILRLTTVVSNNIVNELHVAYQRYPISNNILTPFTNSQVGVTDLRPGTDFLSGFSIGASSGGGITGGMSWGGQYQFGGTVVTNQTQAGDQISWTHGKHTLRAGFEFVRVSDVPNNYGSPVGNPSFARWADFFIGRSSCVAFTGVGTCSAANPGNSNGTASSSITNGDGGTLTTGTSIPYQWRVNDEDAFIQDDFKINSRLTVNLGVRWEYDGWPTEKNGFFTNIWTSLINTVPNPGSGCTINGTGFGANAPGGSGGGTGCSFAGFVVPANYNGTVPQGIFQNSINNVMQSHAPYDNFAPRIGFAWQPTANNRFVIRGGAGFFYEMIPGNNTANNGTPLTGSPVINGLTSANLQNPWQFAPTIPGPPGSYGFTPRWLNITAVNPLRFTYSAINQGPNQQNLTVPVTYEWNLNTQYEFARNWLLELGYVGSHGIWQGAQSRSGQQGQFAAVNFNTAMLAGPGCTSCAITGQTISTSANAPLRVPYLGLTPTSTEVANFDNYKYNSLQVSVRKQLSYGLQLQGSYTWSRGFIQLPYGINTYPYYIQQYEPNDNYRPQRFVLNYLWNLPLGHQSGLLGRLTSGWTWSGVFTLQDGYPITVTDGRAGSAICGGSGCNGGGLTGTANLCPGVTNVLSSGSMQARVTSGLTGVPTSTGGLGYFQTGAFCAPPLAQKDLGIPSDATTTMFGNTAGGIVLGPGQNNWDMSLAKLISVRESQSVQFRAEFFDAFNHPQFSLPSASANGGSLGVITATSVSPRIIQLALKYTF